MHVKITINRKILNMKCTSLVNLAIMTLLLSCSSKNEEVQLLFQKQETSYTGIDFVNELTNQSDWNALNYLYFYTGAGVTTGDFNNDGLEDIYFVANQNQDKLYQNLGNFKFKETTDESQIKNATGWSSGVTTVDINNDGLLDIYVSKLGGYKMQQSTNLLYVNQGISPSGVPIFKEEAARYGLDIKGFNHQAAFLDYDLDGDLDVYILQYSVNPKQRYVPSNERTKIDLLFGGKFYQNDQGKYRNATQEASVYSSAIAFGLGVAVSDINNDGYPDIYVSNDFYENDYLYINQRNASFAEQLEKEPHKMPHTSNFAMGNTIADINNDGYMDIFALDMLPDDLTTRITSDPDISKTQYNAFLAKGYHPQFIRNTLQINDGRGNFSDLSFQAGIAATDWSWASLFADFDNDGFKDLYVTTGIYGATNDKDFVDFMASDSFRESVKEVMSKEDLKYLKELPQKRTPNYLYKNTNGISFIEMANIWHRQEPSFSNGAVYSDLDNDGDLDIIVNNVNEPATLLKNEQRDTTLHYLKVRFNGSIKNKQGIGARVTLYADSLTVTQENYISKGYLSAVSPSLHIGIGNRTKIDSLLVVWPDHKYEVLHNLKGDQNLLLDQASASRNYYQDRPKKVAPYTLKKRLDLITHKHSENDYNAFNEEPLIPYALSSMGPKMAVGDIDGNGLEDLVVGGGKNQLTQVYLQKDDGTLEASLQEEFSLFAQWETTAILLEDTDGDQDLDLIIGHGGQEVSQIKSGGPLLYFKNENGTFKRDAQNFKGLFNTYAVITGADMDGDGDTDLFVGASVVPGNYGLHPNQKLFENDGKGNFQDITPEALSTLGMVSDAKWILLEPESLPSLVIVGHWMAPTIFSNTGDGLKLRRKQPLENYLGFWNRIQDVDINNDGRMDFVVGNFGTNMLWSASQKKPIRLYLGDFNDNGDYEPIVTYTHKEREIPFNSKTELAKLIPQINKKYLSYQKFAKASVQNIVGQNNIKRSFKKHITTLESMAFINIGNGRFKANPLPFYAQSSSIHAIDIADINQDGYPDLVVGGNMHQFNIRLSRLDASRGLLLLNAKDGNFKAMQDGVEPVYGEVRDIKIIKTTKGEHTYIWAVNNDTLQVRSL